MKGAADRLSRKTPPTKIEGTIHMPPGLQSDPRFIVPDEVIAMCANHYDLAAPGLHGIDPMCGVGTIPRVIMALRGVCDAIELDTHQYTLAKNELPNHARVLNADCMAVNLQKLYDYIYTSVPFVWFEHHPHAIGEKLALAFKHMLKPGGMLIIDSDDVAKRDGRSWPLAESQIQYFTTHGFRFDEAQRFVTKGGQSMFDTTFTELKFSLQS